MKRTFLLAAVSALTLASPAWAQQTDHSGAAPDPHTGHATETRANTPAPADSCTPEHPAMGHCTPPPMTTAHPAGGPHAGPADRTSVVYGKSVSVRVDLGGRRRINKKTHTNNPHDDPKTTQP